MPRFLRKERGTTSTSEPDPVREDVAGTGAESIAGAAAHAPETGAARRKVTWTRITCDASLSLQKRLFSEVADTGGDDVLDDHTLDSAGETAGSQAKVMCDEIESARASFIECRVS